MVNKNYVDILNELKVWFYEKQIEPALLYSHFAAFNFLSSDEIYIIQQAVNSTCQINAFFDMLKSKPDSIFDEFKKLAKIYRWQDALILLNHEKLLLQNFENVETPGDDQTFNKPLQDQSEMLQKIRYTLKEYLADDVQMIFKYWQNMAKVTMDTWDNFYNPDMLITDEFHKRLHFANFADLFKGQKFKRVLITAPAGYGKSTFVHEMVKRWVNDNEWTRNFDLVFLFRLGEVTSSAANVAPLTLKNLLRKCFINRDDLFFADAMFSNSLIVFDGFDELQRDFISDDVYDIIVGNSKHKPYVVITSRPETCLQILKGSCNLNIELRGFTEMGISNHLKNFGLEVPVLNYMLDIVKVPLFATLYGIIHRNVSSIGIKSVCSLIEKCVNYLLTRYRMARENFTKQKETNMFYILGQAAQVQFAFCRLYKENSYSFSKIKPETIVPMPEFSIFPEDFLTAAKSAHLVLPSSSEKQIFFPHRLFAEYFAAYFWSRRENVIFGSHVSYLSEVKNLQGRDVVRFKNHNYCCDSTSWFSAFLSFFNNKYKINLWNAIMRCDGDAFIPLFDNYEDLPSIKDKTTLVECPRVPDRLSNLVVEKSKNIYTDTKVTIVLLGATGSGKSSTGNILLGENCFPTFFGQNTGTQISTCKVNCMNLTGLPSISLKIVDTPSLFDPPTTSAELSDIIEQIEMCRTLNSLNKDELMKNLNEKRQMVSEMLKEEHMNFVKREIEKCIKYCAGSIDAFFFVMKCNARFDVGFYKTLDFITKFFQASNLINYLFIAFTHADELETRQIDEETFLTKYLPHETKDFLDCVSNRHVFVNNTLLKLLTRTNYANFSLLDKHRKQIILPVLKNIENLHNLRYNSHRLTTLETDDIRKELKSALENLKIHTIELTVKIDRVKTEYFYGKFKKPKSFSRTTVPRLVLVLPFVSVPVVEDGGKIALQTDIELTEFIEETCRKWTDSLMEYFLTLVTVHKRLINIALELKYGNIAGVSEDNEKSRKRILSEILRLKFVKTSDLVGKLDAEMLVDIGALDVVLPLTPGDIIFKDKLEGGFLDMELVYTITFKDFTYWHLAFVECTEMFFKQLTKTFDDD